MQLGWLSNLKKKGSNLSRPGDFLGSRSFKAFLTSDTFIVLK